MSDYYLCDKKYRKKFDLIEMSLLLGKLPSEIRKERMCDIELLKEAMLAKKEKMEWKNKCQKR